MQLVAPRAVTIAVAILAIICTMNFPVSLLLIMFHVSCFMFNVGRGLSPKPLVSNRLVATAATTCVTTLVTAGVVAVAASVTTS